MKKGWIIPIVLFVILIVGYTVRGMLDSRLELEVIRKSSMEDMISADAVVIKSEQVYQAQTPGTVEAAVSDGTRVNRGATIAVVYSGEVDQSVKNQLAQINKKIEVIENNRLENTSFSSDLSKLESEIASQAEEASQAADARDMEKISDLKYSISAVADKKAVINGQSGASSETLDELRQQKQDLEAQIGAVEQEITADEPGIFCGTVDGMETLLTPDNVTELTPAKIDETLETARQQAQQAGSADTGAACKVIDNFQYYIALCVPADKAVGMEVGDTVSLRFGELSTETLSAEVFQVGPEEDGRSVLVLECTRYLEGLLENRTVHVDVIKNTYDGYRVSLQCLKTEGDTVGIYVVRGSIMYFIPVNVLYSTDTTAIVTSADETNPIKIYDEVVREASAYEDGRVVD